MCSIPIMKIQLLQLNVGFFQQIVSIDEINLGLLYKSFLSNDKTYECTDHLNCSLNYINK